MTITNKPRMTMTLDEFATKFVNPAMEELQAKEDREAIDHAREYVFPDHAVYPSYMNPGGSYPWHLDGRKNTAEPGIPIPFVRGAIDPPFLPCPLGTDRPGFGEQWKAHTGDDFVYRPTSPLPQFVWTSGMTVNSEDMRRALMDRGFAARPSRVAAAWRELGRSLIDWASNKMSSLRSSLRCMGYKGGVPVDPAPDSDQTFEVWAVSRGVE